MRLVAQLIDGGDPGFAFHSIPPIPVRMSNHEWREARLPGWQIPRLHGWQIQRSQTEVWLLTDLCMLAAA
jgi:hypothetical protein